MEKMLFVHRQHHVVVVCIHLSASHTQPALLNVIATCGADVEERCC